MRTDWDMRTDGEAKAFLDHIDSHEFRTGQGQSVLSRRVMRKEWPWPVWLGNPKWRALFVPEEIRAFGIAGMNSRACFVFRTDTRAFTIYRTNNNNFLSVASVDFVQW